MPKPPPAPPAIEPEEHGEGPPPRRAAELDQDDRARAVDEHSALGPGLAVAAGGVDPVRDLLHRRRKDRAAPWQHAAERRFHLCPGRDRSVVRRAGAMPEPVLPTILTVLARRGAQKAKIREGAVPRHLERGPCRSGFAAALPCVHRRMDPEPDSGLLVV